MSDELDITLKKLKDASRKTGQPVWKAIAEELDKHKRLRNAVNISAINRFSKEGDIVAVPGKVLASGKLDHTVTVAAYSFSQEAKDKIEVAGGKVKSLNQLVEEGADPSKIKIVK